MNNSLFIDYARIEQMPPVWLNFVKSVFDGTQNPRQLKAAVNRELSKWNGRIENDPRMVIFDSPESLMEWYLNFC